MINACRRTPRVALFAAMAHLLLAIGASSALNAEDKSAGLRFSESFDDARLTERGWYDGDRITIAPERARAGAGCGAFRWKADKSPDFSAWRRLFEPTETVHLRAYVRLSKGWGWSGRPYHPHCMHFMTTENVKFHGPAASHLTVYIEPVAGKLRLAAQDIENEKAPHGLTQGPLRGGYNGKFYDSKDELFTDDQWHCVEAMFRLNTLDLKNDKPNADGIVRAWFDDKLVIDETDVILRSTDFP